MLPKINPTTTQSWKRLVDLAKKNNGEIRHLFLDEDRIDKFSHKSGDFLFDFSKNNISEEELSNLIALAKECEMSEAISAQFNGENINETEDRAVLHSQLRNPDHGTDKGKLVGVELEKIKKFSNSITSGSWKGYTGKAITNIVNIGIGGSDLGPKMVTYSLRPYWKGITPHFISNVDAAQLVEELESLNPETTLFIIASKTFTTQETMTNAETAKGWFLKNGGNGLDISKHFVAVSTNEEAVQNFGISPENIFVFWDWVGGRYSLWSAIGLVIACTTGYDNFKSLLDGAHEMDTHFQESDLEKNLPMLSALIGIWYNNFLHCDTLAILPYDHRLRFLPSYLQQADMESNGKTVDRSGNKIEYETGPVIWGEPGTNGQHAFYQLIHQGSKIIPCEFIAFTKAAHNHSDHHDKLLANFFAQSEALLNGKSEKQLKEEGVDERLIPFKIFEGNRPSTSILIKELTPFNLGKLIAFYEHRIFAQGIIWNVFSFDQWGVELGKQLAKPILKEIKEGKIDQIHDQSTVELLNHFIQNRK
ncbi:MAG: glucose-6-phosphate isomerase [Ekhidna sp.]